MKRENRILWWLASALVAAGLVGTTSCSKHLVAPEGPLIGFQDTLTVRDQAGGVHTATAVAFAADGTLRACCPADSALAIQSSGGNWSIVGKDVLMNPVGCSSLNEDETLVTDLTTGKLWSFDRADNHVQRAIIPSALAVVYDPTLQDVYVSYAIATHGVCRIPAGGGSPETLTTNVPFGLSSPWGVAVTSAGGRIYISDTGHNRVLICDHAGNVISIINSSLNAGSGPGQFDMPHGVAIDGAGRLYVADTQNGRVEVFTSSGTWLEDIRGGVGLTATLTAPWGLAIDSHDHLVVSTSNNNLLYRFLILGNVVGESQ